MCMKTLTMRGLYISVTAIILIRTFRSIFWPWPMYQIDEWQTWQYSSLRWRKVQILTKHLADIPNVLRKTNGSHFNGVWQDASFTSDFKNKNTPLMVGVGNTLVYYVRCLFFSLSKVWAITWFLDIKC